MSPPHGPEAGAPASSPNEHSLTSVSNPEFVLESEFVSVQGGQDSKRSLSDNTGLDEVQSTRQEHSSSQQDDRCPTSCSDMHDGPTDDQGSDADPRPFSLSEMMAYSEAAKKHGYTAEFTQTWPRQASPGTLPETPCTTFAELRKRYQNPVSGTWSFGEVTEVCVKFSPMQTQQTEPQPTEEHTIEAGSQMAVTERISEQSSSGPSTGGDKL